MEMKPHIVYVKTNDAGYVVAANSSAFLGDIEGWTEIDRGFGDKYHHAQGNYFPRAIYTTGGAFRYKLVDGVPVECSVEEITEQETLVVGSVKPTQEERISDLEEALEMLLNGVTE